MTPDQFARQAGEYIPVALRTPTGLYTPVAVRALELGVIIRDEGDRGDEVLAISGALLRYLLAPGSLLGLAAPPVCFDRIERLWEKTSLKCRHVAALREFQLLAASYVSNGAALSVDPSTRARRLARMAQEAVGMVEHLSVVLGHHGYSLSQAAHRDLDALRVLAEPVARVRGETSGRAGCARVLLEKPGYAHTRASA